jgi:hypothetical protein
VDPHGFCVDLRSFWENYCEATGAKLLILLKAVTAGCGATGSKLLILLENCASAWFSEKSGTGRKKALGGSPATERLMSFMSLDRSFPI